jgi:hypothetical protein
VIVIRQTRIVGENGRHDTDDSGSYTYVHL